MSEDQEVFVVEQGNVGCCTSRKLIYHIKLNKLLLGLERRVLDQMRQQYRDQVQKKEWSNSQCPIRVQIGKLCIYFKQFLHLKKFKKFYKKKRGVMLLQSAAVELMQKLRINVSEILISRLHQQVSSRPSTNKRQQIRQQKPRATIDLNSTIFFRSENIKLQKVEVETESFKMSEEQRQSQMQKLLAFRQQTQKVLQRKKLQRLQRKQFKIQVLSMRLKKRQALPRQLLLRALVENQDLLLGQYEFVVEKETASGELIYSSKRKDMYVDVHVQTVITFQIDSEESQLPLGRARLLPFQWSSPPVNGMQLSLYLKSEDTLQQIMADIDAKTNLLSILILTQHLRSMIIAEDPQDPLFRRPIQLPPVRMDYFLMGKMFLNSQSVKITRPANLQQMRKEIQLKKLKELSQNTLGQQISRKIYSQFKELNEILQHRAEQAKPIFQTGLPPQARIDVWNRLLKSQDQKQLLAQSTKSLAKKYASVSSVLKQQLRVYLLQYISDRKVIDHRQQLQQITNLFVVLAQTHPPYQVLSHPALIALFHYVILSVHYVTKFKQQQLIEQGFWLSLALIKNVFSFLLVENRFVLLNHVQQVMKHLSGSATKYLRSIAINCQQLISSLVVSCFTRCCTLTWTYIIDIAVYYFHLGKTAIPNIVHALLKLTFYLSGPGSKEIFQNSLEVVSRLGNSRQIMNVVLQSANQWQSSASRREAPRLQGQLQVFREAVYKKSQQILRKTLSSKYEPFKQRRLITSLFVQYCSQSSFALSLLTQNIVPLKPRTLLELQLDCQPFTLRGTFEGQDYQSLIDLDECCCQDAHYELVTFYLKQDLKPVYVTLRVDLKALGSKQKRSELQTQALLSLKASLSSAQSIQLFERLQTKDELEVIVRTSLSLRGPFSTRLTFLYHFLSQYNQISVRLLDRVLDVLYRLAYKDIVHTAAVQNSVLVVARTYKGDLLINEMAITSTNNQLFHPQRLRIPDIKSVRVETNFQHYQIWTPKDPVPLFIRLSVEKISLERFCNTILSHEILRVIFSSPAQPSPLDCKLVVNNQKIQDALLSRIQGKIVFDNCVELPKSIIIRSLPLETVQATSKPTPAGRKCWVWGVSGLLKAEWVQGETRLAGRRVGVDKEKLIFSDK